MFWPMACRLWNVYTLGSQGFGFGALGPLGVVICPDRFCRGSDGSQFELPIRKSLNLGPGIYVLGLQSASNWVWGLSAGVQAL